MPLLVVPQGLEHVEQRLTEGDFGGVEFADSPLAARVPPMAHDLAEGLALVVRQHGRERHGFDGQDGLPVGVVMVGPVSVAEVQDATDLASGIGVG